MVTQIPDPPEGLLHLAWELARSAESTRREIERGDVWMAHAASLSLVDRARRVTAGTLAWHDSVPKEPDPNVNPHGPVPLYGATMAEALEALNDADLVELRSQLAWERDRQTLPAFKEWLGRIFARVEDEIDQRPLRADTREA